MKESSPNNPVSTSLAPWLSVPDGDKAVKFYKAAFGAEETYRLEIPDGGLVVRLSIENAEFWISSEPGNCPDTTTPPLGGGSVRIILTVADPDVFFSQALKAGAIEIFPVGEEHGWRIGRMADPFGLHWEIGYLVSEI